MWKLQSQMHVGTGTCVLAGFYTPALGDGWGLGSVGCLLASVWCLGYLTFYGSHYPRRSMLASLINRQMPSLI